MTENDLVNNVYNKLKGSPQVPSKSSCRAIVDTFIDEIKDCLVVGDKVVLKGFMSFEVKERPAREGRNPQTGKVVTFPAVKTIKCKLSKAIKDAVNGKGD